MPANDKDGKDVSKGFNVLMPKKDNRDFDEDDNDHDNFAGDADQDLQRNPSTQMGVVAHSRPRTLLPFIDSNIRVGESTSILEPG